MLGSLPNGGDLAVRTTGTDLRLRVSDGVTDYEGVADDQGRFLVSGLPAGVPLWLYVDTIVPYTLDIDPGTTGLPAAVPDPGATGRDPVTRPRTHQPWLRTGRPGRAVTGTLTLASTADTASTLTLDWATSDPDWTVGLGQDQVELAAGATVEVPLTISVLSDAAVDGAVRLTVRARDAAGGQTTGWTDIASDPDAAPDRHAPGVERAGRAAGWPGCRIGGARGHAGREHRPGRRGAAVRRRHARGQRLLHDDERQPPYRSPWTSPATHRSRSRA